MVSDISGSVSAPQGRIRKRGGGRKRKIAQDPTLVERSEEAGCACNARRSEAAFVVDVVAACVSWSGSWPRQGHKVWPRVVGELLRGLGYSLQANSKTKEGD